MTAEPLVKGRKLSLSTTQTATDIDSGTVVMMSRDEALAATEEIKAKFGDLRRTIYEFEVREGYKALGYDSFRAWAVAEIDQVGMRQVYRLLAAAETETNLGIEIGQTPEAHLRPLAQLPAEQQRDAWELADQIAGNEPRQAAHVAVAAQAVGDYEPLTTEELGELDGLGGWVIDPSTPVSGGKVAMRLCRGDDWSHVGTRSPGGWRYEIEQLRKAHEIKQAKESERTRELFLIAQAELRGFSITPVVGGSYRIKYNNNPWGGLKNVAELEAFIASKTCTVCGFGPLLSQYSLHQGDTECYGCRMHRSATYEDLRTGTIRFQDANRAHSFFARLPESDARTAKLAKLAALIAELEPLAAAEAEKFRQKMDAYEPRSRQRDEDSEDEGDTSVYTVAAPAPAAPAPAICSDCGTVQTGVMYNNRCQPCYHIRQAQQTPAPFRPGADQQYKTAMAHLSATLAGLLERASPAELKLLCVVIVGDEVPYGADDQDLSESIWQTAMDVINICSPETVCWGAAEK